MIRIVCRNFAEAKKLKVNCLSIKANCWHGRISFIECTMWWLHAKKSKSSWPHWKLVSYIFRFPQQNIFNSFSFFSELARHCSNGFSFNVILVLPKCHFIYGMSTQSVSHEQCSRTSFTRLSNASGKFDEYFFFLKQSQLFSTLFQLGGEIHHLQELQAKNRKIWQFISNVKRGS